ncbi:MAG: hydrogenase [Chloroflexi bacterium]|nr:hydrogenase [Chloroflexota bacterium]
MIPILLCAGLIGVCAAWTTRKNPRRGIRFASALGMLQAVLLALASTAAVEFPELGPLNRVALFGIAASWLGASLAAPPYYTALLKRGELGERDVGDILLLTQVFMTALSIAAASRDLAIAWVALEVTTMTGAFLVASGREAHGLEAAWKLAVLCFGGVGFGLVGIGLIAASSAGTGAMFSTNLDGLANVAHQLNPQLARIGFAVLIAGFGTKAGFVPMHWWLPDAHSQSPSPVSALMSGGLVATSLVVLVEARAALAPLFGGGFFQLVFIILGLTSMVLSNLSMVKQADIKRLLAYSTIEHIGLMAVAVGIGTPLAAMAFVVHLAGHALAKTAAFISAGGLAHSVGSRNLTRVAGSLARDPLNATAFLVSSGALLGLPPGPLFLSELLIIMAAARAKMPLLALAVTALLAFGFAAFAERALGATLGSASHSVRRRDALAGWYALGPAVLLGAGAYCLIARPDWVLALVRSASLQMTGGVPW